jgi:hypothetical protein
MMSVHGKFCGPRAQGEAEGRNLAQGGLFRIFGNLTRHI